jgi:hypothetical protein
MLSGSPITSENEYGFNIAYQTPQIRQIEMPYTDYNQELLAMIQRLTNNRGMLT